MQEEKAEWIIYVTDEGQSGHFKLVFGSGRKAGIIPKENPPRIDHVGFGLVLGADGKRIRTRDMGAVSCTYLLLWTCFRMQKDMLALSSCYLRKRLSLLMCRLCFALVVLLTETSSSIDLEEELWSAVWTEVSRNTSDWVHEVQKGAPLHTMRTGH